MKNAFPQSSNFRKQTYTTIAAIILFLIVFIILLLASFSIMCLCFYLAYYIFLIKIMYVTVILGITISVFGVLIFVFVVRSLFQKTKTDISQYVEITEVEQPQLVELIQEMAKAVGTKNPKHIYLSADVNASVFYDSSFLSLFLPVRKNLVIGMGLINSVTEEELKAILCHEFGHFSQKSLRLGSYVYHVNQIISKVLFDSEKYDESINGIGESYHFSKLSVYTALKFNEITKWILSKMYTIINKQYLGLSREMEFHADAIAASVVGVVPFQDSLLRLSFASEAFDNLKNYYFNRISDNVKSENLYNDHRFVMKRLAEFNQFEIENDLPFIRLEYLTKYNKSKLFIKDNWSTHPTDLERIKSLNKSGLPDGRKTVKMANEIVKNIERFQKIFTTQFFSNFRYKLNPFIFDYETFKAEYELEFSKKCYSSIYNGFFDDADPNLSLEERLNLVDCNYTIEELFSEDKSELVYEIKYLHQDIDTLKQIEKGQTSISSFEYDGNSMAVSQIPRLLPQLKETLEEKEKSLQLHLKHIYAYFEKLENDSNQFKRLSFYYSDFHLANKALEDGILFYNSFFEALQFINEDTQFSIIRSNFDALKTKENELKKELKHYLDLASLKDEVSDGLRNELEYYISNELVYFAVDRYRDTQLQKLYAALNCYVELLYQNKQIKKRELLEYQHDLYIA